MKKMKLLSAVLLLAVSFVLSVNEISAQTMIQSSPDTIAYSKILYLYDVDALTGAGKYPITFSLVENLDGMLINPTTGLITWTPDTVIAGGKVIVKATNAINESDLQEFFIYVSDAIPCDENLEAYWKLDETDGPTYYDWIGDNDAVALTNSPSDSAGIVDIAQSFNPANNEGLSVPVDTVFNWGANENFSVELWFKKNTANFDSVAVLAGRNGGSNKIHWWLGFLGDDNDSLNFIIRDNSSDQIARCKSEKIENKAWHHIVGTRNASTNKIRLYVDGVLKNEDSYNYSGPGLVSMSAPLDIAWLEPHGTEDKKYPFNGIIDEVRLYGEKALSESEVANNYYNGTKHRPACKLGNFAPLYTSTPVDTAHEDQPYTYTITANDPDVGDIIDYALITKPDWLNYDAGTRTFSGTPQNSDVGNEFVITSITDSKVVVEQSFTLATINKNDPPLINSTPVLTVNEEELYLYDVDASDIDVGDNLTFTAPVKPAWLSINSATGELSGTPPVDDTSEYSITVRVTDDSAAFDEQSYTLDILNVNDAPVITGQPPLEVDEDNTILIGLDDILYTDVDNGPTDLTLTVLDGVNYSHAGNLVTPALHFHGNINVPVELSDLEYTDEYTLSVTVNSVNDIPRIVIMPSTDAYEDSLYSHSFKAVDDDTDDTVKYSVLQKPTWLSVEQIADYLKLIGTPRFIHIGENTLILRSSDGEENLDTTITITVNLTNNTPYITSTPPASVNEDNQYTYNVTYTDADPGDIVTLSKVTLPTWLKLNGNVLSGLPTNDQVGTEPSVAYTVKLKVSDGQQDSTQTFTVTVNNVNDAPVITGQPDTLLAYAGTSLIIGLNDITVEDVDNVPGDLSVLVFPGANYTNSGDTAKISATAPGIIHVNIRVSDGELQSLTYSLNVKVFGGTGIHESYKTNSLITKIYPVPARDFVSFKISTGNNTLDFELLTIQGQVIMKDKILPDTDLFKLNTSNIPSGVYYFKFIGKNSYQTGVLTIQK